MIKEEPGMRKVTVFSGILVVLLVFSCVSAPETTVPPASAAPVAAPVAASAQTPAPSKLDIIEKSIADGDFQEIEYKYILDMSRFKLGTSATGKPTLPADLVGVLNYLGMSFEAGTNPRREYYYLFAQAPNREFNDAGLIYRIREETGRDLARITLKFRMPDGATPEFPDSAEFENFVNEFDAGASGAPTNDRASISHTFSVAYDYEFEDPKGVRFAQRDGKIDFAASWNFLKAESPAIASYIEKTYPSIMDPGTSFPGEVYSYRWRGWYSKPEVAAMGKNSRRIEFTIDYWTMDKDGKKSDIFELSFGNPEDTEEELVLLSVENKKALDTLYLDLYRKLWHLGLVHEVQSSKTNLYFSTFGK
jgi:hypothetical protein